MRKCTDCGYEATWLEYLLWSLFGKDTHLCEHEGEEPTQPSS
jgi:hypothetical protein